MRPWPLRKETPDGWLFFAPGCTWPGAPGWTGLIAQRAKDGFFVSVVPSLNNQSALAGMLANLYSDRAAIIESSRNNGLHAIERATEALDATEVTTSDRTAGWKTVQGVGMGITTGFGWSGKGAVIGAAVTLVGFLGENLDPGSTSVQFTNNIEEAVGKLNDKVDELNTELEGLESDYRSAARQLRFALARVHSYNLELYDLTQNNPEGDREEWDDQSGFHAEVDKVLRIAEFCYEAGDQYEGLLALVRETDAADDSLSDKDGKPTEGDEMVLELREQLHGHLRTTCGRYLVAGDQVREAAEAYVEEDTSQSGVFDRTMTDWEREGVGEYDVDFAPDDYAAETDRSPANPYTILEPGWGDGEDYRTEEDR